MSPDSAILCSGVLALELPAGVSPARLVLDRDEAGELAELVAYDLGGLLPGARALGLSFAGALYDQAQLLRPGWPVFHELAEHYRRASRESGTVQIVAIAGDATQTLRPQSELSGGPLQLMPWVLHGNSEDGAAVSALMEDSLVGQGEAGTATVHWLASHLGMRLEHARYLSRHDLCALASVQLEHAGMGALWELLETALLAPQDQCRAVSNGGQVFFYRDAAAHAQMLGFSAWRAGEAASYLLDKESVARGFIAHLFELRQYAALLAAHHLPLHCNGGPARYWIEQLGAAPDTGECRLFAHQAPGLGVIAISAAVTHDNALHPIAHGYPLTGAALAELLAEMRERFAASDALIKMGRLVLSEDGRQLTIATVS